MESQQQQRPSVIERCFSWRQYGRTKWQVQWNHQQVLNSDDGARCLKWVAPHNTKCIQMCRDSNDGGGDESVHYSLLCNGVNVVDHWLWSLVIVGCHYHARILIIHLSPTTYILGYRKITGRRVWERSTAGSGKARCLHHISPPVLLLKVSFIIRIVIIKVIR